ncbi:Venom allergen-like protein vap-2 [Aphelenchoides fujianensis]|nr:Venom allergen-like protein vap-2 [Aphelenchoides fujianensis]
MMAANQTIASVFCLLALTAFFCSPTAALSDAQRKTVLEIHNQLRSDVALGKAINKNGTNLPTGSNIFRVTYAKWVEKLAADKANSCKFEHSYVNNTCNNLYLWAGNNFQSVDEALNSSIGAWYDELHADGLASLHTGKRGLNHFTELVWHDVVEIGCAVSNCTKITGIKTPKAKAFTFVVCDYAPGK